MNDPLKIGDRVRHYGQRYTVDATGTVEKVTPGNLGGWEYEVRQDKAGAYGNPIGYWHSSKTIFVSRP